MLEKYSRVKVPIFNRYALTLLLVIMVRPVVPACSDPLGMENGKISDSQITTTNNFDSSSIGYYARLHNTTGRGGWCPNVTDAKKDAKQMTFTQYIQIDLRTPNMVVGVSTQGQDSNTQYPTKKYRISYSFDNSTWKYIRHQGEVKIFTGNGENRDVVPNTFRVPIVARYIRIYPGYYRENQVCLRLELHGCPWMETGRVRSYSMPVGDKTPNGKVNYTDRDYNGKIESNKSYVDGVGYLTDGKAGPVDSKEFEKGRDWVGWNASRYPHGVNITFEFYAPRKFRAVVLTMNINKKRQHTVFEKSRIFFAKTENSFHDDHFLEYFCPTQTANEKRNFNVSMSLCGSTGTFVKLQLHPRTKFMLISEVTFESDAAKSMEANTMKCGQSIMQCNEFPINPTTKTDCAAQGSCDGTVAPVSDSTSNTRTIIVIVCVILLAVIILLVLVFVFYRRRLLCFAKVKHRQTRDDAAAVHVELNEREIVVDPAYDKLHDDIGNPLYAMADKDDEKRPMMFPVMNDDESDTHLDSKRPDDADVYSEPNVESPHKVPDEYAEPVDSLSKPKEQNILGNPIYEGVYSEPLYGVTGTILVGPQEETLKRGATMEKFPSDHLVFKEKIGDGQFGEVHIAEARIDDLNVSFGEEYEGQRTITVAVKTLKKNVSKDVKTDFFKEVRVMSRLQHENVVRLLGVCRDEPVCMIVEYMANGDLNQYLRSHVLEGAEDEMIYANTKQPINYGELVYIAYQIAAGMKYFASMSLVHRDLAARNCLVGDGLTVKLADFGMSRLLYSKHYYRVQGKVMLPIRWMAPESIFQGRFTTQTDVWSFGITLWEVFTLAYEFPYPDLSDEQVIGNAKVAFSKQPTATVIYNHKPEVCPDDIYRVLKRCWTSNPQKRPSFDSLYDMLSGKVGNVGTLDV